MHISDFIEQQVDPIVEEWVEFARSKPPPSHDFTNEELADHAKVLLVAVAAEIRGTQDAQAKHDKSQGGQPEHAPEVTRIGREHAAQRFNQGFSFDHLVAEFRALRASVIRRWTTQLQHPSHSHLDELTRFGESLDQALAESTSLYSKKVDDSRNLLLGVLGHDLRTPLGVVHMSAQYLLRSDALAGVQTKAVVRILTASERMRGMVKDILDFTQTAFGVALPIVPAPADIAEIARAIVGEVATLHPDSRIDLNCESQLPGRWDAARVGQMLSNLIGNAVQHGAAGEPISVVVTGHHEGVLVQVTNLGPPISAEVRQNLFTPLRQT